MQSIKEIKLAQLVESNALSITGTHRSLSAAELEHFGNLCRQMQAYYPHQEFARETVDGYMFDLERIAITHGIDRLEQAFLNVRLRREQKFFPHPTEVLEEIERVMNSERRDRMEKAAERQSANDEADFWAWVDRRLEDADTAGMSEQQFLDSVKQPGWTGRKARTNLPSGNVVSMPPRDRKTPGAGAQQPAELGAEPWYMR
jgi:hypothetical protein